MTLCTLNQQRNKTIHFTMERKDSHSHQKISRIGQFSTLAKASLKTLPQL